MSRDVCARCGIETQIHDDTLSGAVCRMAEPFEVLGEAAERALNPVVDAIRRARESIARGERASIVIDSDTIPALDELDREAIQMFMAQED